MGSSQKSTSTGDRLADRRKKNESDAERELARAIDHPLRRELLKLLLEQSQQLSSQNLAELTEQSLPTVSYHMRVLEGHEAVEPVADEPIMGSVNRYYEPTEIVRETPWLLAAIGLSGR
jgi:DNA-binding transcriptional ArsR family regulator